MVPDPTVVDSSHGLIDSCMMPDTHGVDQQSDEPSEKYQSRNDREQHSNASTDLGNVMMEATRNPILIEHARWA